MSSTASRKFTAQNMKDGTLAPPKLRLIPYHHLGMEIPRVTCNLINHIHNTQLGFLVANKFHYLTQGPLEVALPFVASVHGHPIFTSR